MRSEKEIAYDLFKSAMEDWLVILIQLGVVVILLLTIVIMVMAICGYFVCSVPCG